jgi:hypothetical protein
MSSFTTLKASLFSLMPHKNEASLRIRNSSAALVTAFLLTQLTPAPSPWTAVDVVFYESGEGKSAFWIFCAAGERFCFLGLQADLFMAVVELVILGLFTLNALQGALALMYPPKSLPPTPSPSKSIKSPQSQKRRHVLSPNVRS